jgi:hypothetical protein
MDRNSGHSRSSLPEWAWRRHANPLSGWTRVATTPVVVYALYHRNWRLVALLAVWVVLNPVAFPPPHTTDAWMTRGVLAEREWIAAGNRTVGLSWPNVLNLLNLPTTAYLGWATLRRRPVHTVVATTMLMTFKLWWVAEIVEETGVEAGEPMPEF